MLNEGRIIRLQEPIEPIVTVYFSQDNLIQLAKEYIEKRTNIKDIDLVVNTNSLSKNGNYYININDLKEENIDSLSKIFINLDSKHLTSEEILANIFPKSLRTGFSPELIGEYVDKNTPLSIQYRLSKYRLLMQHLEFDKIKEQLEEGD